MEIIDFGSLQFRCGVHHLSADLVRVDIGVAGRLLISSVPLNRGWKQVDEALLNIMPDDVRQVVSRLDKRGELSSISDDLFGFNVCGDELFRMSIRYYARSVGGKSDVVISIYWSGDFGSVFWSVDCVLLQCEGIISTEDDLDSSWDSLKVVPLIPLNQRDTYLEPPSALPI